MRKLSATRPATLREPHDNTPSHDNPPRPARQLSRTSTTALRPRQPSATNTPTLRDQHDNPLPSRTGRTPDSRTDQPEPAAFADLPWCRIPSSLRSRPGGAALSAREGRVGLRSGNDLRHNNVVKNV